MSSKDEFLAKYGTVKHLDKILSEPDNYYKEEALRNPLINSGHINKALDDKNPTIRYFGISHPNASSENITKALNDEKSGKVRSKAIFHDNATEDHVKQGILSHHYGVAQDALSHWKITPEHLKLAIESPDVPQAIKVSAVQHRKLTPELLDLASRHPSKHVRWEAINHENATKDQLTRMQSDPDEDISWTANDKLSRGAYGS